MQTVSLFDAKTHLARLIDQIATGAEDEIIVSRNGKPVARVLDVSRRICLAQGEFETPNDIDAHNAEVAALFQGRN
jgi:prevent-host-death family protein